MKIVKRSEFCEDKKVIPVPVEVGQVYRNEAGDFYLITAKKEVDGWYLFHVASTKGSRSLFDYGYHLQNPRIYTLVEATLVIEEDSK